MNKVALSLLSALALTFQSRAAVILTEAFTYPDGPLITAPGSPWVSHSGVTPGQVNVASGSAELTGVETEDVSAPLSGSPYSSGTVLTATFDVNFSTLPTLVGNYFAHFKDAGTGTAFRARTFASPTGAAAGFFRLGISNDGGATAYVALDLSLGTSYAVAITWNTDTNQSSISINGGAAVTDTDAVTAAAMSAFALRQSNSGGSMGALTLDNLEVSATPIPEPTSLALGLFGLVVACRRRR